MSCTSWCLRYIIIHKKYEYNRVKTHTSAGVVCGACLHNIDRLTKREQQQQQERVGGGNKDKSQIGLHRTRI